MREQLEALERKWRDDAEQVRRDPESFCNAKIEGYTETLDECADDLRTILDSCAVEVEADAARYRWLKEHLPPGTFGDFDVFDSTSWDSAIDATLQRDRQP